MNLINGTAIADTLYAKLKEEINDLPTKPKLGIILANSDEASERYVRIKQDKATELGIEVEIKVLGVTDSNLPLLKQQLVSTINNFNTDNDITGYLIQLPLHKSIRNETSDIINLIQPEKDIDGLTAINLGKISHLDKNAFISATVEGILESINQTLNNRIDWLDSNEVNELTGKNIVIINNSNLIGKPLCNGN